MIILKSEQEISCMRAAGRLVAATLAELRQAVQPGMTTGELDEIAESKIRAAGAEPTFKGYYGFPASICASVDSEVVHGIPGQRVLQAGEIISIDIGAKVDGFNGDAAITVPVGEVSAAAARLIAVTENALKLGIEQARPGNRLTDISHAVQAWIEASGFSVVRDYVGHGIGRDMHEDPQIPNYGPPGRGPLLEPGMVLAIEPMVNAGGYRVKTLANNWTVVTEDGSLSAHFEHTVAVTAAGPEILTCL
ncbi:MAG: type I methionyl aminopeptidase [bacterium]|jgi:methionyl aminopeptidase